MSLNPYSLSTRLVVGVVEEAYRAGPWQGLTVSGRLEGGFVTAPLPGPGHTHHAKSHVQLLVVPKGTEACSAKSIMVNGAPIGCAVAGDTIDLGLGGIDEAMLMPGQVLCWPCAPIKAVFKFKAQLMTFPTLDIPIMPGQQFTLHSHALSEPCNVTRILRTLDKDGHTKVIKPRLLAKGQVAVVRIKMVRPVCLETFADHRRLGCFVLRYAGHTVAAGMILKIKR
jgi:elongation factor 1 alpha-like protein